MPPASAVSPLSTSILHAPVSHANRARRAGAPPAPAWPSCVFAGSASAAPISTPGADGSRFYVPPHTRTRAGGEVVRPGRCDSDLQPGDRCASSRIMDCGACSAPAAAAAATAASDCGCSASTPTAACASGWSSRPASFTRRPALDLDTLALVETLASARTRCGAHAPARTPVLVIGAGPIGLGARGRFQLGQLMMMQQPLTLD